MEKKKSKQLPFVHEFEGPYGVTYIIKFLGDDDATYYAPSTKRIITGPGIVMEENSGGSLHQRIIDGCRIVFLDDNYQKAAMMAEGRITC